jgi:cytochrome c
VIHTDRKFGLFSFSKYYRVSTVALASSPIVWSDTTLNRWLTDPEALIPGQRMNVRVLSADDRADLIAFLRRESGK